MAAPAVQSLPARSVQAPARILTLTSPLAAGATSQPYAPPPRSLKLFAVPLVTNKSPMTKSTTVSPKSTIHGSGSAFVGSLGGSKTGIGPSSSSVVTLTI